MSRCFKKEDQNECKRILLDRFAEPKEIAEVIYFVGVTSTYLNDSVIKYTYTCYAIEFPNCYFVIEANDGYGPVELQSEVFNIVTEYSPIVPEHTHNFVEGKCECGEQDPNYVAPEEPKKKCGKKSADVVIAAIALTAGISIIFRKKD